MRQAHLWGNLRTAHVQFYVCAIAARFRRVQRGAALTFFFRPLQREGLARACGRGTATHCRFFNREGGFKLLVERLAQLTCSVECAWAFCNRSRLGVPRRVSSLVQLLVAPTAVVHGAISTYSSTPAQRRTVREPLTDDAIGHLHQKSSSRCSAAYYHQTF